MTNEPTSERGTKQTVYRERYNELPVTSIRVPQSIDPGIIR